MAHVNFNNKSLVFPQIKSEKGRTSTRQLMGTTENCEQVTSTVSLTEVIQNKTEMTRAVAFDAKARAAMLKLTTPGPKGMHLLDNVNASALRQVVADLQQEAASINSELTVCHVEVDCLVLPVNLTLDAHTAERIREHIQNSLVELRKLVTTPDMALSPTQRYSLARTQYYACQHLVHWVTGLNSDTVVDAIKEAGEACSATKSQPVTSLPALEIAITLFDAMPADSGDVFVDLPF